MPRKKKPRIPSLRCHKASGNAFVELNGQRRYLGRYDDPASRGRYDRTIAEWLANGRHLPVEPEAITVVEVIDAFWKHAERHYRNPDGTPGHEQDNFRLALRPLKSLYGSTAASEFGPRALKTIRQWWIDRGAARMYANRQTDRVRRMFKWAAAEELIPAVVWQALTCVKGLQRGRTEAPETEPVTPVPGETVAKTLPHLTPTLRGMVELQRFTGMRPGEVCILRPIDLDTTGTVWTYKPAEHKTAWRGKPRLVFIGPRGQEVLRPFLRRETHAYCFSPRESEAERLAVLHAERKTPLSCGNKPGTNRVHKPKRTAGDRYDTQTYGRAIAYACDQAFPPPNGLTADDLKDWRREHRWSPNRLRHTFATEVRRDHGLEAAQVLLGHAMADVTQVYAERDAAKAAAVALKIG